MTHQHRSRSRFPRLILLPVIALAVFLTSGTPANAQTIDAICEQYPTLPQCEAPEEDRGGPDDDLGPAGAGDDDDGELPFTGYPLTDLVLLALLLILVAVAVRAVIAVRDRWSTEGSARGGGGP